MSDIDNDWFNGNMDYETDSDSDSDIDTYNYNNKNNWSTFTGDKINKQPDRHSNSFLDRINKNTCLERKTVFQKGYYFKRYQRKRNL